MQKQYMGRVAAVVVLLGSSGCAATFGEAVRQNYATQSKVSGSGLLVAPFGAVAGSKPQVSAGAFSAHHSMWDAATGRQRRAGGVATTERAGREPVGEAGIRDARLSGCEGWGNGMPA